MSYPKPFTGGKTNVSLFTKFYKARANPDEKHPPVVSQMNKAGNVSSSSSPAGSSNPIASNNNQRNEEAKEMDLEKVQQPNPNLVSTQLTSNQMTNTVLLKPPGETMDVVASQNTSQNALQAKPLYDSQMGKSEPNITLNPPEKTGQDVPKRTEALPSVTEDLSNKQNDPILVVGTAISSTKDSTVLMDVDAPEKNFEKPLSPISPSKALALQVRNGTEEEVFIIFPTHFL